MLKTGFMKKVLVIAMLAMVATAFVGVAPASAKNRLEINFGGRKQQKKDARRTLRRTAEILQSAQEMASDRREERRDDRDRHGRHGRHGHGDRDRRHGEGRDGIRHRGLGRAFAFQQRAEEFYHDGEYERAINLSLHSRAIALRVIQRMQGWDNDENWRDDGDDFRHIDMDRGQMDDNERRYWDHRPSDDDMDVEINGHEVDDDASVSFKIKLDF